MSDIIPRVNIDSDSAWADIIDSLVDSLSAEELPDEVIQATELLISGQPAYMVGKKLRVSAATIKRWLRTYPAMAAAVANSKELLTKWRLARLEEQFMQALDRSSDVLGVGLDGMDMDGAPINPKVLAAVASHARYIIGLFAGQKSDVTVTHELGQTVLKANKDALEYIAEQMLARREAEEPIEVSFRVIDAVDQSGPVVANGGAPNFGEMGVLDVTEDGAMCHVCGSRYKSLATHILGKHGISTADYEVTYILPDGSVRQNDGYWGKDVSK